MELRQFKVTASSGQRIRVGWIDDEAEYWFMATTKDNGEIKEILGSISRRTPTVFRQENHTPGSKGISYHDAHKGNYHPEVEEATRRVYMNNLAALARQVAAEERSEREAGTIGRKAERMRALLVKHGNVLELAPDAVLAAFFDDIQDSAI